MAAGNAARKPETRIGGKKRRDLVTSNEAKVRSRLWPAQGLEAVCAGREGSEAAEARQVRSCSDDEAGEANRRDDGKNSDGHGGQERNQRLAGFLAG
jgi:hypothetical protein